MFFAKFLKKVHYIRERMVSAGIGKAKDSLNSVRGSVWRVT